MLTNAPPCASLGAANALATNAWPLRTLQTRAALARNCGNAITTKRGRGNRYATQTNNGIHAPRTTEEKRDNLRLAR
eukprot:3040342-Lingulodinium_polyedra.AAC.1